MLNRRTSNLIFYGSLVLIVAVVLLVRTVVLTQLDSRIEEVTNNNRLLTAQIEQLAETVQEYKDVQIDHIYSLYAKVPNSFNKTELTYYTIAQLESVGVDEDPETYRSVTVNDEITFHVDSDFADLQDDFKVVKVEVYFNTMSVDVVDNFIDKLYESEQVFIIDSIEYYSPDGENFIGVTIHFLAFYEKEIITEEAS